MTRIEIQNFSLPNKQVYNKANIYTYIRYTVKLHELKFKTSLHNKYVYNTANIYTYICYMAK